MDYLEIPAPSLPRGFLELAEGARNVNVEIEQCCYTDDGVGDCYGVQFICTKCGSYDGSRYLYLEDTTHSWPLEQVGFVRIEYK